MFLPTFNPRNSLDQFSLYKFTVEQHLGSGNILNLFFLNWDAREGKYQEVSLPLECRQYENRNRVFAIYPGNSLFYPTHREL